MQRKWFSYVRIPWKMGPEKKYIKENKGRGVGMLKDFPKRWGKFTESKFLNNLIFLLFRSTFPWKTKQEKKISILPYFCFPSIFSLLFTFPQIFCETNIVFFFFFFFNSSNFISIVNRDEVSENALVFEQFPLHFIFIHIFDGDPIKNTC